MVYNNARLLALTAMFCVTAAQAREASLVQFSQSTGTITPTSAAEDQVGTALRFHLQSMADSGGLTVPNGRDPISWETRHQNIAPGPYDAPAPPEIYSAATCMPEGYAPTWWLPPEVEVRRAAHFDAMASIACEFGIPISLLDTVIAQESGYKPWAVSGAGAMGIMQIMPGTARSLGLALPFDPIANMRAGARYLRLQIDRFRRIDLALAAYNAGPERRSLAAGYVPAIPETMNYVRTISRNWARLVGTPATNDLRFRRAQAAASAVLAAGYRSVELTRYDGMNAENPI